MQLFECDNVNIEKIYNIEIYKDEGKSSIVGQKVYNYSIRLNTFELIYFVYGENNVSVDNLSFKDTQGSLRFLPKGVLNGEYRVEKVKPSCCIDIYFDTPSPMPARPTVLYESYALQDKFLKIYEIWQSKTLGYYAEAMMMFYDIIASVQKSRYNYLSPSQKKHLQTAYNYIAGHFRERNFDYNELCSVTGLKYAYFSEIFKKEYHMPPSKMVTKMRIDYAKELLVTKRLSVSEIAEMCGFENTYYFSTVFKKQTGFSPTKYPFENT